MPHPVSGVFRRFENSVAQRRGGVGSFPRSGGMPQREEILRRHPRRARDARAGQKALPDARPELSAFAAEVSAPFDVDITGRMLNHREG